MLTHLMGKWQARTQRNYAFIQIGERTVDAFYTNKMLTRTLRETQSLFLNKKAHTHYMVRKLQ